MNNLQKINVAVFLFVILLVNSCGQTPGKQAEVALSKWIQNIMTGNIEAALEASSDLMKARWLYRVYEQIKFTDFAKARYKALPEELVKSFDNWLLLANSKYLSAKSLPNLTPELSNSEWFKETIKQHYEQGRELIQREFRNLMILETAVEFNQATIHVRTGEGNSQIYILTLDKDEWKVDWNKPAYGG